MQKRHLLVIAMVCLSATAEAQYRYVAPDGTVTFSDQPPAGRASQVTVSNQPAAPILVAASPLPYTLAQASSNFPVTLYTNGTCSPCDSERSFLKQRGIPFSEKTVTNDDDIAALKRVSGAISLPVTIIGSHKLNGFSESAVSSLLDEAGYPAASALPRDYAYPSPVSASGKATPSSAAPDSSAPTVNSQSPPPQAVPEPPPATGNAPPGFKF